MTDRFGPYAILALTCLLGAAIAAAVMEALRDGGTPQFERDDEAIV